MRQYFSVKEEYPGVILFYRLGDFYEMFFDDAVTASKELDLVLTGRDCGLDERAPMCGVPYHACDQYIGRLLAKGYSVAICEQLEDPSETKGMVRRDVVRVVTPGTVTDPSLLDEEKNNFLCVFYLPEGDIHAGLCFCDISTGQLFYGESSDKCEDFINAVTSFSTNELIINSYAYRLKDFRSYCDSVPFRVISKPDEEFDNKNDEFLVKHLPETDLDRDFSCNPPGKAVITAISYLLETQKTDDLKLSSVSKIGAFGEMRLPASTIKNLDLLVNSATGEKRGSLVWTLDMCRTSVGKRLLKQRVTHPLTDVKKIRYRLDGVGELLEKQNERFELRSLLDGFKDIQRITGKVSFNTVNARDLRAMAASLKVLPQIKSLLSSFSTPALVDICGRTDTLEDLYKAIDKCIVDDPPLTVKDGGIIRQGVSEELDSLRELVANSRGHMEKLAAVEQEKTGIKKLKIGYNRVFGYFFEVTNSFKELVPQRYIRKQTLANAERYVTEELKELENAIMTSGERQIKLENQIFSDLVKYTATFADTVNSTCEAVAELDVSASFAEAANRFDYVKPVVEEDLIIDIKGGRHPVVERFLKDSPFVPNDVFLDAEAVRTLLITGPNMAGKSTFMRQTALIVLMAQIGCFVPAKSARIGIADNIYTRVGASDNLAAGESTFMSEMNEVSYIVKHASRRSLIILDEIGRGTSTYDGMCIARAVLEYINNVDKIGSRTLFATHYHELTELEDDVFGVVNCSVAAKKRGDDIVFLRRIVKGPAPGSYGIEVASLAGVPETIVKRAKKLLRTMDEQSAAPSISFEDKNSGSSQLDFFSFAQSEAEKELDKIDPETLTPLEALKKIYELKALMKEGSDASD